MDPNVTLILTRAKSSRHCVANAVIKLFSENFERGLAPGVKSIAPESTKRSNEHLTVSESDMWDDYVSKASMVTTNLGDLCSLSFKDPLPNTIYAAMDLVFRIVWK